MDHRDEPRTRELDITVLKHITIVNVIYFLYFDRDQGGEPCKNTLQFNTC